MKLTSPLLPNAKPQEKPYKIRDRDSMYLRVSVSGSKVWKFDYRLDRKDCSYTLERFPNLSICDARERRNDAAKLLASGIHPKVPEQQSQLQTTHTTRTPFGPSARTGLKTTATDAASITAGRPYAFSRAT